jgi:Mrp family chromosome partitioning ATPase
LLVRTRELLEGVNAPILGVILNDMKAGANGYGTYYYYKHEYK